MAAFSTLASTGTSHVDAADRRLTDPKYIGDILVLGTVDCVVTVGAPCHYQEVGLTDFGLRFVHLILKILNLASEILDLILWACLLHSELFVFSR